MKTRLTILNVIIVLCCTFATTSVFGQAQTTYIWTNQFPANTATPGDLGTATNWSPNGVPSGGTGPDVNGIFGDELQWNGLTTGPLDLTANTITTSFSGSASGVRVHLTPSQTSPVSWRCLVPTGGGVRIQNLLIESGAGGLTWGDTSTNALDFIAGGVQNQVHGLTNNSTTAAVINPTVRWRMGGGGAHFFLFEGTGDWIVNNRMRSQNGATMIVQKTGSGTMTWTATNVPNSFGGDALGSPITIGAGTLIMKSSDIVGGSAGQPNIVNNGTLLRYDAPAGLGNIAGIISGTGPLQMSSGSLTLASALSTFTGNITLSGGTLTAGGAESLGVNGPLGVGGTISFAGGTLVYSANNAADYSPRFSTAAGQTYSIDTAGNRAAD